MSKSPSLRRIQADIRELALDPSDQYHAAPLESDMFEWHFTIRGAKGTDFEGGIYHGRILLPPDYPFKPPHIMFLTPSGRFETNTKICLSFSAYHPELWQPAWGIRLILEALISFLPTPADGAIGALDWSPEERRRLAKKSVDFVCPTCGKISELIPVSKKKTSESDTESTSQKPSRFAKEIEQLQLLQMQEHNKKDDGEKDKGKKETNADEKETPNKKEEQADEPKETPQPTEEPSTDTKAASSDKSEKPAVQEKPSTTASETPTMPEAVPPPQPQVVEAVPAVEAQPIPAAAVDPTRPVSSGVWWLLDPLLQLIIVLLSAICYLLLRKVQSLVADLEALEDV